MRQAFVVICVGETTPQVEKEKNKYFLASNYILNNINKREEYPYHGC